MPTAPLNSPNLYFDRLDEIKDILRDVQERLRQLETREAGASPLVNSKLDALWRRTDEHGTRLAVLERIAIENRQMLNSIAWTGAIAGTAIILFLINSILHNTFPLIP